MWRQVKAMSMWMTLTADGTWRSADVELLADGYVRFGSFSDGLSRVRLEEEAPLSLARSESTLPCQTVPDLITVKNW